MATIYYIDSENVGDSWIDLLEDVDGRFIVFYTGHSPRIAYPQVIQLMNAVNKPEFVSCYEGNNGLDFQLVTYLGYELHVNSSNEMIIVSNDTGFDAAVLFWTDRGMNVKRVAPAYILNSPPKEKREPVSDEEFFTDSSSAEVTEWVNGIDKRELYAIINCIGANDSASIHLAFIHFYGNQNGEDIYKLMKKEKFSSPCILWTKEEKLKKLIELIIQYTNTANIPIPDSFPGFILNNIVDDKKSMSSKINKSYGGAGPQLNKMFKPFYKMLAKIKKR